MEAMETHNVKFAKGDSFEKIAKKYDVKPDRIWKLADNKKIVQERRTPDKLQPGDALVIPPSDKAIKAAQLALKADIAVVDGELLRIKKRTAALDKAEKDIKSSLDEVTKLLQGTINNIKNVSNAVDLAAIIISLGRMVAGAMKKGLSAIGKVGEELEKHTAEVQKDAINLAYSPFKDVSIKVVSNSSDSSNEAVQFLQSLVKALDKMTSPSFWTNTAYQLSQGKTWSDSVTTQVTKDVQDHIDELGAIESSQLNKLKRIRTGVQAHESNLKAAKKQLEVLEAGIK